jgi:hypothetical protein
VHFNNGISFRFEGPNAIFLPSGGLIYLAKNPDAFRSRYGTAMKVAGPYSGQLENAGERLELYDADGESVLDFQYQNWYPPANGQGYSLVIRDEAQDYSVWDVKENWQASSLSLGSPSLQEWDLWRGNFFNSAELADISVSGPNADPDGDGFSNQAEFTAGTNPHDGSSFLRAGIGQTGPEKVEFRFRAEAGRSYSVLTSDSVEKKGWTKLEDIKPNVAPRDVSILLPNAVSGFVKVVTPATPHVTNTPIDYTHPFPGSDPGHPPIKPGPGP